MGGSHGERAVGYYRAVLRCVCKEGNSEVNECLLNDLPITSRRSEIDNHDIELFLKQVGRKSTSDKYADNCFSESISI